MQTKLFNQTRLKLAGWYAICMGAILSVCGLIAYQVIVGAYLFSVDRELEAVTETLLRGIEPSLKQPGRLEPIVQQLLPDVCLVGTTCQRYPTSGQPHTSLTNHPILGAVYQDDYYVRFMNSSGQLIAFSGLDLENLPLTIGSEHLQIVRDREGNRYHQTHLALHTSDNQLWGQLEVGRSLKEVDSRLAALQLLLFLGLPITVILIGGSSWLLSGLAMRPLHYSYQQMQQFTADAAHELRTPLAAILATVESVLRLPTLTELEARETLKIIKRQGRCFFELVKDLLLLSRLEQHMLISQPQSLDLTDLINDLVEEFSALADVSDLKLEAEVRTRKSLCIMADEDQISRLISNLVANSIQYTPAGGNITLVLDCDDNYALIQVRDTGIGIAPENQAQIFDRFYRINHDRSRQTGGAGLRLAIARAIAEAHLGSLHVQSELYKGSTFTVRLPFNDTVKKLPTTSTW